MVPYCHASKTLRVIVLSFSLVLMMGKLAVSQLPTGTILVPSRIPQAPLFQALPSPQKTSRPA